MYCVKRPRGTLVLSVTGGRVDGCHFNGPGDLSSIALERESLMLWSAKR